MNDKLLPEDIEKYLKVLFISRGSARDGIGHVTRSRTLANTMSQTTIVKLVVIGDAYVQNLLSDAEFDACLVRNEAESIQIFEDYQPHIVVFDLMNFEEMNFDSVNESAMTVSLSPIFNCLSSVDLIFHRTRIADFDWQRASDKPIIKKGLEYAIISKHCDRIPEKVFRHYLGLDKLAIAISMGGTDAANKTLEVLETIKRVPERLLIWVLLGEGYAHSYQNLVDGMHGSRHEIILAKTNDSMWRILSTCSLAILAGGTTTYEAAYAGLPSINTFETERNIFLIQELLDRGACLCAGYDFQASLSAVVDAVQHLYNHRYELLKMHQRSKGLIDSLGAQRIASDIQEYYQTYCLGPKAS